MPVLAFLAGLTSLALQPAFTMPVSEKELADMRGGFEIPGGIDVAVAIQSNTSIDGLLVLRSVFTIDRGTPSLAAFVPTNDAKIVSIVQPPRDAMTGALSVTFDRQTGVQVSPVTLAPAVNVVAGRTAAPTSDQSGLTRVPLALGHSTQTSEGLVSLQQVRGLSSVHLEGGDFDVSHLFGNALGAVVANAASDRVLDTATTVTIDLSGATGFNLGSAFLRAQDLGMDAARTLAR